MLEDRRALWCGAVKSDIDPTDARWNAHAATAPYSGLTDARRHVVRAG